MAMTPVSGSTVIEAVGGKTTGGSSATTSSAFGNDVMLRNARLHRRSLSEPCRDRGPNLVILISRDRDGGERTDDAIETIGWRVGHEDPAFFRRLFKRLTGVTPRQYRRRFRIPVHEISDAGFSRAEAD